METPAITRRDLETALIAKCWKDPEFKKQVIHDPKGMLERHTGQRLPAQLKIFVYEEDADVLHFSIPPPPQNAVELSDEDLENVAGGTDVVVTTLLLSGAVTIVGGTVAASAAGVLTGTGTW